MDNKTKIRDLTISDIAQLQELQIELLSKVIKICERNGLTYFAYYGALLGAVRHKAHIPWDDDIDIAMPRKDFNQFLKIAKNGSDESFKLWWLSTDKNYPFNFAKIVGKRDDTYAGLPDKFNGPRMDIFPLDSVGRRLGGVLFVVKVFNKMAIYKRGCAKKQK